LLYQVATGLLLADEIAAPIRSILRKQKNTEVLMAEVIDVDTRRQFFWRVQFGRSITAPNCVILCMAPIREVPDRGLSGARDARYPGP
jgi:hypothetical protein